MIYCNYVFFNCDLNICTCSSGEESDFVSSEEGEGDSPSPHTTQQHRPLTRVVGVVPQGDSPSPHSTQQHRPLTRVVGVVPQGQQQQQLVGHQDKHPLPKHQLQQHTQVTSTEKVTSVSSAVERVSRNNNSWDSSRYVGVWVVCVHVCVCTCMCSCVHACVLGSVRLCMYVVYVCCVCTLCMYVCLQYVHVHIISIYVRMCPLLVCFLNRYTYYVQYIRMYVYLFSCSPHTNVHLPFLPIPVIGGSHNVCEW